MAFCLFYLFQIEQSNQLNKINANKWKCLGFFSRKRKLSQSDSEQSPYLSVLCLLQQEFSIWVFDTCFQDAVGQGIRQPHRGSLSQKKVGSDGLLRSLLAWAVLWWFKYFFFYCFLTGLSSYLFWSLTSLKAVHWNYITINADWISSSSSGECIILCTGLIMQLAAALGRQLR